MNKKLSFLAAGLLLMTGSVTQNLSAAETGPDGEPLILELKTDIFQYSGPANTFSIGLGSTDKDVEVYVESPLTQEYVWVNPYSIVNGDDGMETQATYIGLSVTENNNTVKIYGDPSKIDYIDIHGCYLSALYMHPGLVNLEYADVSHNYLTEVDFSSYGGLIWLDVSDNAFVVPEKMHIGTNHPDLAILYVGINEVCDPELDLRNFPNLNYFSAYSNYGLTSVDTSECQELISLQLDATNLTSLDVSKNQKLDILNISQTRIRDIDLSKNIYLGELYINHDGSFNSDCKLTSIDLTKNIYLERLDLGGNLLTEIDLSQNSNLIMLYLMRNRLTSLDIDNCKKLAKIDISRNYLNFSNLPLPQEGWDYYYVQNPIPMALKYKVGEPIDLRDKVIRAPYIDSEGNTITPATYATVFVSPRLGEIYELARNIYTYKDGVITFNEALPDSVYLSFHCTAFEEGDLKTTTFRVKTPEEFELPSTAFSFLPASSMAGKEISFKLGALPKTSAYNLPANVTVIIDGEKTILNNAITTVGMPDAANVSFTLPSKTSTVTVALDDGYAATALGIDGVALSSIDLKEGEFITQLSVNNCELPLIDLGYNRELTDLSLAGNRLVSVALEGVRGDYEKWSLRNVDLSGNRILQVTAAAYETIETLNLSDNALTVFDPGYFTGLKSLDLSGNKLSGELDLTKNVDLVSLDASGNLITSVAAADWQKFISLNLSDNSLSFASLPIITSQGAEYLYSPQQKLQILSKSPAINLSAQNIKVNGSAGTVYVWKNASDNSVIADNLLTNKDGAFKFDASLVGEKVYCEMTNSVFPELTLSTTVTEVADVPGVLVASFTTPKAVDGIIGFSFNTSGDNALYIDWRGDGSEYEPYIYEANHSGSIFKPAKTVAGATAKVYAYDNAQNVSVFAVDSIPMTMFNGEPMTKLRALDIHNAGLQDGMITLPASSDLYELVLDGNALTRQTFPGYPRLSNLNLANNQYTEIDLSIYPGVSFATLSENKISSVKFGDNKSLYQLNLQNNNLSDINLEGLSGLQELLLSDNNFREIDLGAVKNRLRVLGLAGNYLTFATLPRLSDFNTDLLTFYDYAKQKPLAVTVVDGDKVDLSEQAKVGATETVYRWFLGDRQSDVYFDYYYEEFIGEELEGPGVGDDPEYVIENGVTTFLHPQTRKVICAMTNSELPSLILYTVPAGIEVSEVASIFAEEEGMIKVYNLSGVLLKQGSDLESAVSGLAPGLYIIGGKKVLVK